MNVIQAYALGATHERERNEKAQAAGVKMSPNEDRARKFLAMVAYMAADPRESDVAMLTAQFDSVEAAAKSRTVDKVSEIIGRCVQSVIVGCLLGDG